MTTFAPGVFQSLLIDDVVVSRASYAHDGAGGSTETLTTVAEVKGRLRPLLPREVELAGRLRIEWDHTGYFLAGTDVRRGDYVSRGDGQRYRVVEVVEPSYLGHHYEVRLKQERDAS